MSSERPDRRGFLCGTLGAAAAGAWMTSCGDGATTDEAVTEAPGLPDGLDPADFQVHQENPLVLEAKREHQRGLVTPTDKVFVRGNLPLPPASILDDRAAWTVEVGGVANPRAVTVGELQRMRPITVAAVLQCSGNGRKYFPHGASGSPWGVGAAANVIWSGVRVADVVDALGGPKGEGLKYLTGSGGEVLPEGFDDAARAERSVPMERALAEGILALQMNGEPLTLAHGGPVRLVVPGFYGVNNVKFVRALALTAEQSTVRMQQKSYRVRPVGESSSPDQPSMYEMNVKSWITGPLGTAAAGSLQVTGVAFSGESPIESVEVTTDGGASWSRAELVGPDLGRYAWRTFAYPWDAAAGTHVLASRATDRNGSVQPETPPQNERGYAHNGWRDPAVTVEIA
ncbi:MAG: sulfite oxidase [Planctomycetota bacterium]|nr:sulfite oxidase [Planctomycetota bacterium]